MMIEYYADNGPFKKYTSDAAKIRIIIKWKSEKY
jgi:hypothetical protein